MGMNTILEIPERVNTIVLTPPPTDEEFEKLCFASERRLERTREGTILVNPPTAFNTSDRNREITHQLSAWWDQHERGRAVDSSAGFFLPDGSMFSPDAAYIREERAERISEEEGEHLLHVVPDFVVELLSGSDSLTETKRKMEAWISNGVELGWLVDPYRKQVLVYESGKEVRIEPGDRVQGTGPVEGFTLNLVKVWRCSPSS